MDENGRLLYSKDFVREKKYDDNLLIGFFTSITNFSREALGTAVKNVDLGENNKLIIVPKQGEHLFGAVIVSSNDNNELVSNILKNILQEFIDSYSPDYDTEKIIQEEMEKTVQSNLKRKTISSPIIRVVISWLINGSLIYPLILLSIFATLFIFEALDLTQYLYGDDLFTKFFPALILLSTGNIIILFLFPNFLFGILSPNRRVAIANSIIHLVVTIILFAYSSEPAFAYIVIGHLPLTLIFSLFFLFSGMGFSSKRFLKN
jgi:hypothetical protein